MTEHRTYHRLLGVLSHLVLVTAFMGLGVALFVRSEQDTSVTVRVDDPSEVTAVPASTWQTWIDAGAEGPPPFSASALVETSWSGPAHDADVRVCFSNIPDADAAHTRLEGIALAHVVSHPDGHTTHRVALHSDSLEGLASEQQGYCVHAPPVSMEAGAEDAPHTLETFLLHADGASIGDLGAVSLHVVHAPDLHIFEKLIPLAVFLAMLLKLLAWSRTPRAPTLRTTWRVYDPILALVALVLGTSVVIAIAQPSPSNGLSVMVSMVFSAGAYIGLCWLLSVARSDAPETALGVVSPEGVGIRTPLILGVLMAFGAAALLAVVGPPEQSSQMQELTRTPGAVLAVTATALLAPWYEELFFRGLIYGAIEKRVGALWAVTASALLFALLHVQQHIGFYWPLIPILALSLTASVIRYRSRSTTSAFALHLGYNALLIFTTLLQ